MGDVLTAFVKFVLAVVLLPVAVVSSRLFYKHILAFSGSNGEFFLWGAFGFLLLFLFLFQFWGVYEFGWKFINGLFQFAAPANRLIANALPFYMAVIVLAFFVTVRFLDVHSYDPYFMFFAGFAFAMHILLTAQDLQGQDRAFIKPSYFLEMTVVLILTVVLTVLFFDLAFTTWTFPKFFRSVANNSWEIYRMVGQKILLLK